MPTASFAIAVKACIVRSNTLLMVQRRTNDRHKPGTWDVPGGRLAPAENPFEGLRREIREEIGHEITIHFPLDVQHFTRDDGQAITMILFACTLNDPALPIRLSEEHTAFEWRDLDRVDTWIDTDLMRWLPPVIARIRATQREI